MANSERVAAHASPLSADACDPDQRISLLNPERWGWLTCQEAAQALGVTPQAVRRAAREGRIFARRPAWLGKWLVPASEVERLLEQGEGYYG